MAVLLGFHFADRVYQSDPLQLPVPLDKQPLPTALHGVATAIDQQLITQQADTGSGQGARLGLATAQMQALLAGQPKAQTTGLGPWAVRVIGARSTGCRQQPGARGQRPEGVGQRGGRGQQGGGMARDKTSIQLGGGKGRMRQHPAQEGEVAVYPTQLLLGQHRQQTAAGGFPVFTPGNQLAQHRVVERRDAVALDHPAVDPPPNARRWFAVQRQLAAGGQKVLLRVFGIQPHFDGVAAQHDLLLAERQRLPLSHTQLPGDQILPGDQLGHRVLDLQTGIHLHEEELATGVEQKLHGSGAYVANGAHGGDRRLAHGPAQFG